MSSGMARKNAFEQIYSLVARIPQGRVATYGLIAVLAGNPRWARVVGYALHVAPDGLPCHRVVNRFGNPSSAFSVGSENQQVFLLKQEGVEFLPDGRVDLERYLWEGETL